MYKSQLDLSLAVAFYRNDNFKSLKTAFSNRHKTTISARHRLNTKLKDIVTIILINQSDILHNHTAQNLLMHFWNT